MWGFLSTFLLALNYKPESLQSESSLWKIIPQCWERTSHYNSIVRNWWDSIDYWGKLVRSESFLASRKTFNVVNHFSLTSPFPLNWCILQNAERFKK